MCIPLLALVIAGTFFFGQVMRNQQRLRVADRYVAWRLVHNRDAQVDATSHAYVQYGEPDETAQRAGFDQEYLAINNVSVTTEMLNERFFSERAENIVIDSGSGPADVIDALVALAGEASSDCGELADYSVGRWRPGESDRVDANFPSEVAAWERIERTLQEHEHRPGRFSGRHERRSTRDDVQWRRWQNSYLDAIREVFLFEFDETVQGVTIPQLKENLEDIYLRQW